MTQGPPGRPGKPGPPGPPGQKVNINMIFLNYFNRPDIKMKSNYSFFLLGKLWLTWSCRGKSKKSDASMFNKLDVKM